MAVMKVYGRQAKVEAKRTPAFEVKLEVHQAKGLDTHLFDGGEKFYCTITVGDDFSMETAAVLGPCPNWEESFNLPLDPRRAVSFAYVFLFAKGSGQAKAEGLELGEVMLEIGKESERNVRSVWYKMEDGVALLISLSFLGDSSVEARRDTLPSSASRHVDVELHAAVIGLDVAAIQDCLGRGANASALVQMEEDPASQATSLHRLGWSPLHRAAERVDGGACASVLLQAGADVCARCGPQLWTPLHMAAAAGSTQVCRTLLAFSADSSMLSKTSTSPLQEAVLAGETGTADALLAGGAEACCTDGRGMAPLHWAARSGDLAMVQLLLNRGADANMRVRCVASSEKAATTGATPLHFAARAGHMEVQMALLGAGAVATEPDAYGRTPLQEAAFNGHQHCARHLLALTSKGESAHAVQDDYGMTALHWAVLGGHSACITILRGTNASASTDKHRQADIETAQVMVQFSSREHLQPSLRSV